MKKKCKMEVPGSQLSVLSGLHRQDFERKEEMENENVSRSIWLREKELHFQSSDNESDELLLLYLAIFTMCQYNL